MSRAAIPCIWAADQWTSWRGTTLMLAPAWCLQEQPQAARARLAHKGPNRTYSSRHATANCLQRTTNHPWSRLSSHPAAVEFREGPPLLPGFAQMTPLAAARGGGRPAVACWRVGGGAPTRPHGAGTGRVERDQILLFVWDQEVELIMEYFSH
jgi:hypothetical protein